MCIIFKRFQFLIVIIAIVLQACSEKNNQAKVNLSTAIDSINIKYYGRSLNLGDLTNISSLNTSMKFTEFLTGKKKVISYYDADCSVCFAELNAWKNYIKQNKLNTYPDLSIGFVLRSADSTSLDYLIKETVKIENPVFYDRSNSFFLKNLVTLDKPYHTFILDQDNKILLVGSPIKDKEFSSRFLKNLTR